MIGPETTKEIALAAFYIAAKNVKDGVEQQLTDNEMGSRVEAFSEAQATLSPLIQSSDDREICDEAIATSQNIQTLILEMTAEAA